jgi:transcriptional regulator with XRE-family HTH domain
MPNKTIAQKKEELFRLQFGAFFKAKRIAQEWHQTQMASVLGVTQGTISKIESGKMSPDLQLYLRFKKFFNVTDYEWEKE